MKGYVIKKPVGEQFEVEEMSFEGVDTLSFLQNAVGGYIECVSLDNDIDIWINEEGKINGSKPNTAMLDKNGDPFDVIFGDFVVTSHDSEGETIPLTIEQVEEFASYASGTIVVSKGDEVLHVASLKFDYVEY